MATIRVRSTDGSNSDDGSTWALAKLDLAGAAAVDAPGDVVYVSNAHAESTASSITLAFAGTAASPVQVICVDDAADPPTTPATSATVATTGLSNITLSGYVNVCGLNFSIGSATGSPYMLIGAATTQERQTYRDCKFSIVATGVSARLDIGCGGSTGPSSIEWRNCGMSFANAAQGLGVTGCSFSWIGGSILAGSTPTTAGLFRAPNFKGKRAASALLDGVDLSNLGSASYIFDATNSPVQRGVLRNCKLPASWTGGLVTGTFEPGARFEVWNCDSADTTYKVWIADYAGSIVDESTIVRTGGSAQSWKMVTSANAEYPGFELASPEVYIPLQDGVSATIEAEIVTDGVTLKTSDARIEVLYMGTSGNPLGVVAHDGETNVLTGLAGTSSNQTSSSETWTTTGLSSPVKQTLSVTVTPQATGIAIARVIVSRPSTTVYVDRPRKV